VQLQGDPISGRLQRRYLRRVGRVTRIRQHTDPGDPRKGLSEQLQSLDGQLGVVEAQAGDIPAWTGQARYQPGPHGIGNTRYHDRNRCGRLLGSYGRWRVQGQNEVDPEPHEFIGQRGKLVVLALGIPQFERDVLPFELSEVLEPGPEGLKETGRGSVVQKHSDAGHGSRLLRVAVERRQEQNKSDDDRSEPHRHLRVDTTKLQHASPRYRSLCPRVELDVS
jgi:hypothetical protein